MSGKRFNSGKVRIDLIPANAELQVAKVFTNGADKYGDNNWEKGMDWTNVIQSMARHFNAIRRGEDYDKESGLLHSAHVAANALMLTEYYYTHPEYDNRFPKRLKRIGLDIDGVLADFVTYHEIATGIKQHHNYYNMNVVKLDSVLDIPVLDRPHFDIVCYITSRREEYREETKQWLINNNMPVAPVIHTKDKAKAALDMELDLFVEDCYQIASTMPIPTFLVNRPWNIEYDYQNRINNLSELNIYE